MPDNSASSIVELPLDDWSAAHSDPQWTAALEAGKVLFFPHLAFHVDASEQALFRPDILSPKSRNISLDAEGHLKALDMIASTADNLQSAIDGETYEFTEMYPPMLDLATSDGHKAKTMFKFAMDAEEVHAKIYKQALEAVKKGVDLDVSEFHLCPVCGYIELGQAPEKCPVCGAKKAVFEVVA